MAQSRTATKKSGSKGRYPKDEELERSVIGSCLLNGSHWWNEVERAAGGSSEEDLSSLFYGADTLLAARAMSRAKLISDGNNISLFKSAYSHMVEDGQEDMVEEISMSYVTRGNINDLDTLNDSISQLSRLRSKREILSGIQDVEKSILDPTSDPYEAAEILRNIAARGVVSEPSLTINEVLERIDNVEVSSWQIKTGIRELDKALGGGFEPGRLSVLAARPKVGKTTFALDTAIKAAVEQNIVTMFVSLEMNDREIMSKMLANLSGIEHRIIMKILNREEGYSVRDLSPDQREEYENARQDLIDSPMHMMFAENTKRGISDVIDSMMSLRMKYGESTPMALFYDYAQLGIEDKNNARAELDNITRRLKLAALELNIAVITLSQVNRSGADSGIPSPHQMRESGGIEQDADNVTMLHRETKDDNGDDIESDTIQFWLALNRNGPTVKTEARWIPAISVIEGLDDGEAEFTIRKNPSSGRRTSWEEDNEPRDNRRPRRRIVDDFDEEL